MISWAAGRLTGRPAVASPGRYADEDENPLFVHVEEALGLEVDRSAGPRPTVAKPAKSINAPEDRPVRVDGAEVELGVGGDPRPGRQAADVGVDLANELDVLLRHARPVSLATGSTAEPLDRFAPRA